MFGGAGIHRPPPGQESHPPLGPFRKEMYPARPPETRPLALNWDGVHAFAAMKADVLQRGIEDVEEWIAEACELEVDAGGYDDDGGPYVGDNYDAARDYIPSALE